MGTRPVIRNPRSAAGGVELPRRSTSCDAAYDWSGALMTRIALTVPEPITRSGSVTAVPVRALALELRVNAVVGGGAVVVTTPAVGRVLGHVLINTASAIAVAQSVAVDVIASDFKSELNAVLGLAALPPAADKAAAGASVRSGEGATERCPAVATTTLCAAGAGLLMRP